MYLPPIQFHDLAYLFSLWSNCIKLIDKDDGRSILFSFLKGLSQVTLTFSSQLTHDLRA